jgi:transcription antitermination factor NusG
MREVSGRRLQVRIARQPIIVAAKSLMQAESPDGTRYGEAINKMLSSKAAETESMLFEPLGAGDWCAIQTRPRHEKAVTQRLTDAGIATFLPLYSQVRTWSDRHKRVEFPLFPGYVFARSFWTTQARVRVFQTSGVVCFVGPRKEATPIPAQQIDAIRLMMRSRSEYRLHPYLDIGQRVRIRTGSLEGLEGILVRASTDCTLVVSVDLIHRSVALCLDGYEVECI